MSSYTIELRKVCELYGRDEVENWFKSYNLEDFLMPIQIQQIQKFNVWSKEKLAKKIVDHYYMREIGFETPALFQHYAKLTMQEIMEKYLLEIYTKFLEYDPLSSVDYTEEYTREIEHEGESSQSAKNIINSSNSGNSESSSTNNGSGLNVTSNTPQGQLNKSQILQGKYASQVNASETDSSIESNTETSSEAQSTENNTGSSNENSTTVEKYTHTMKGDNGVIVTNQYLVREFRELATNIDSEIINELNSLFMGIY